MAETEEYVEQVGRQYHDDWIDSGPSTLVSEMILLIEEAKQNKGLVLSQEAAMMACVESKRNAELLKIRYALKDINDTLAYG
jgi:hypothetical protein